MSRGCAPAVSRVETPSAAARNPCLGVRALRYKFCLGFGTEMTDRVLRRVRCSGKGSCGRSGAASTLSSCRTRMLMLD